MAAVTSKRAKHSAPGQYLGFGLQPIRMCFHLLTAPAGSQVSLEHEDDVAVYFVELTRFRRQVFVSVL